MEQKWRVHAWGVGGSEFVYEVAADTEAAAKEAAYGEHGRRLERGDEVEQLGVRAKAVPLGVADGK